MGQLSNHISVGAGLLKSYVINVGQLLKVIHDVFGIFFHGTKNAGQLLLQY